MKLSEVPMVRGTMRIELFSPYLASHPHPARCWSIRHPWEEEDQSEHEPHIPLKQVFLAGGVPCLSSPSSMTSGCRSSCPSPRLKGRSEAYVCVCVCVCVCVYVCVCVLHLLGKAAGSALSTLRPKPFSRPAINRIYVRGFA